MKRMSMCVTLAPECFQYTIQKAFNNLVHLFNMVDGIVVFGVMTKSTKRGYSRSWTAW